jgi:hypothetical protein
MKSNQSRLLISHPHLGTHAAAAALALQNVANVCDTPEEKKRLRSVVQQALSTVKSFSGIPDPGTIEGSRDVVV